MRITLCFTLLGLFISCSNEKKNGNPQNNPSKASNKISGENNSKLKGANEIKKLSMSSTQITEAKELIGNTLKEKIDAIDAKKIYSTNCALCHGFKGDMKINGAKDLTKSLISIEESVAQVYFGKGLMKPYKGILKDEEIIAVCNYIEKELRK